VEENVPIPNLNDMPAKKKRTKMIIQTKAVALACGDCRVLSGHLCQMTGKGTAANCLN
jgi:hypothetical protein